MATFDGEALLITLDPVVDGVLDVDVGQDLYAQWKAWMLQGNMRFPPAFRTTGGDELTEIIDAGAYFFLRNDYGWRVKPYENDGTYYLIGNLAVQLTSLPALVSTTGAFTAAILGLQPVTQGVTAAMGAQLEQVSLEGGVAIDPVNGLLGTGLAPTGVPIGSRLAPAKLISDAHTIAVDRGLNTFYVMDDLNIATENFHGHAHVFRGDSPFIVLTIEDPAIFTNAAVENLTIVGELDGLNTVTRSNVGAVTNVSGFFEKCVFTDSLSLSGPTHFIECYSSKVGAGYVNILTGTNDFQVSDWHRSLGITGMTAGTSTIEMYGGQLHLDASCTGGTIYLRGNYSLPPDDQSTGTTLIDQTENVALWGTPEAVLLALQVSEAWKLLGLDPTNPLVISATQQLVDTITLNITGTTTKTVTRV